MGQGRRGERSRQQFFGALRRGVAGQGVAQQGCRPVLILFLDGLDQILVRAGVLPLGEGVGRFAQAVVVYVGHRFDQRHQRLGAVPGQRLSQRQPIGGRRIGMGHAEGKAVVSPVDRLAQPVERVAVGRLQPRQFAGHAVTIVLPEAVL